MVILVVLLKLIEVLVLEYLIKELIEKYQVNKILKMNILVKIHINKMVVIFKILILNNHIMNKQINIKMDKKV
jgi:hypothetical protein